MADAVLDELLAQFGPLVGMPGLRADDRGVCHLLIDGCHLVRIVRHPRGYLLWSCAVGDGELDPHRAAQLLQANFGQAAGGIVLCQGPDRRACLQFAQSLKDLQANEMGVALDALMAEADRWRQNLLGGETLSPSRGVLPLHNTV